MWLLRSAVCIEYSSFHLHDPLCFALHQVARKSMAIASQMCVYTNTNYTVEIIDDLSERGGAPPPGALNSAAAAAAAADAPSSSSSSDSSSSSSSTTEQSTDAAEEVAVPTNS
jgi:hypothetical protein